MWSTLIEESFEFAADVSGGRYRPSLPETAGGTPTTAPPDDREPSRRQRQEPSNDTSPRDDSREEPTNRERERKMRENALINMALGILGNIGGGAPTTVASTGADAGLALGQGVNEIAKNEGRGLGGSSESGKEIWDAIEAEHRTEPFERRGQ